MTEANITTLKINTIKGAAIFCLLATTAMAVLAVWMAIAVYSIAPAIIGLSYLACPFVWTIAILKRPITAEYYQKAISSLRAVLVMIILPVIFFACLYIVFSDMAPIAD